MYSKCCRNPRLWPKILYLHTIMTIAAAPATAAAAAEVGTAANENAVIPFRRDPATEALSVCVHFTSSKQYIQFLEPLVLVVITTVLLVPVTFNQRNDKICR